MRRTADTRADKAQHPSGAKQLFAGWTPASLRQLAGTEEGDAAADASDETRTTLALRKDALICAQWMDSLRIDALWFVGPFGEHTLKEGSPVLIPAGAKIYSTRPSTPPEGFRAVRSKRVIVARTTAGYVDHNGPTPVVRNPTITWRGKSGYWSTADINWAFMSQRK
ncbi:MAG: hypothetical protein E6R08_00475 [Nevskiaceae bacterium]|nr:MAG: hypothetical protein E6R08_00475 [Nevskiaceae bacterium]